MAQKQTLRDIKIAGKTLLVLADLDVPVDAYGVVIDDFRLRRALPTIEHAIGSGAKVVLLSHFGPRTGKRDKKFSLEPIAGKLEDLLHKKVKFVDETIGQKASQAIMSLRESEIILLENLNFCPGEINNDAKFVEQLSEGCDYFIQDCFEISHENLASTVGLSRHLPSVAGLLLDKELKLLNSLNANPKRPFGVIVGGDKTSQKLKLVKKFAEKADYLAVVGAVANVFLLAEGVSTGRSPVDKNLIGEAVEILDYARARMKRERFSFYIPVDVVVATSRDTIRPIRVVDIGQHTWSDIMAYPKKPKKSAYTVSGDEFILDIGPMTASGIAGALSQLQTVFWSGTAGVTEIKGLNGAERPYGHGTKALVRGIIGAESGGRNVPFSVACGGDTLSYLESELGLREQFNFVSTGGVASLAFLTGEPLPGVESLLDLS